MASSGWKVIWAQIARLKWLMAGAVGSGICWMAAAVSVPLLVQGAIDKGVVGHRHGELVVWTVSLLGVGLLQGTFVGLRRYLAFAVSYRVEADLRNRLFGHLQRLHFAFHDRTQTGQLMSRSATDLTQIQNFVVLIPLTVANTLILAAVVSILFYENPPLAALALCTLPLLPLAAKRFSTKAFPVSMGLQKELGALAEVVEETVAGIRVVKGFGTEDQQKSKLGAASKSVYELAVQTGKVRAFFAPILTLLPLLGLVAVLWYGGHQVLDHRLTIGQLAAYLLYVNLLVAPLQLPAWVVGQAQRAVASGQRVAELLTTSPEVADPIHPVRLNPLGKGEISFKDVVFSYGDADSQPVLDGFNLKIPGGSAVALVGSTGCGKSTVARLISRFYDVNSGSIQVDGLDVRNCSLKELRKMVGIVFEETFLFTDTIRANIAFADPRSPMDRVARAAQLAGADRFIESLTDGYDTLIGERGFSLSGGQRQRIALARAILSDPRILILDDATSAVDPTKEHEILGAMAEVMKDRTTILIAHRPATVALSDWVVFMDQGKVAAQGTHDELLASDRRYSEIMSGQLAT